MEVHRSLAEARTAGLLRGGALVIGNLDGVHLGHRRLIETARGTGAPRVGVLTFDPHPLQVLRPAAAPPLITPLPMKLERLAWAGVDVAVVVPFDARYAASTALEFVERDLVGALGVRQVVVGSSFSAGRDRAGVEELGRLLEARGVALHVVPVVTGLGAAVSSTRIRSALRDGEVEQAALLLGLCHAAGGVLEGAGSGRALGGSAIFRTAALLPGCGDYLVRVAADEPPDPGRLEAPRALRAVCSVRLEAVPGATPHPLAEVHSFEGDADALLGKRARLLFLARLHEAHQAMPDPQRRRAAGLASPRASASELPS